MENKRHKYRQKKIGQLKSFWQHPVDKHMLT